MTHSTAALHTALPDAAEPPEWVHLVPAGRFRGVDGRGPYTLADPAVVIAASMAAGKLAIDQDHATDLAAPRGEPAPAVGWIVAMEARPDGIWGRVEWNASGAALMADRAYRGFSPVFQHSKTGEVTRVLRAALTNNPNLAQLKTLHTQDTTMDLTALRAALGLAETADEAAILAAIASQREQIAAHATALQAAGATAETVTALQAQLTELRTDRQRDRATLFIDGAIRDGKPINPVRDRLIAQHMADPEGTEALVAAMPSINAGGQVVRNAAGNGDGDEPDPLTVEMSRRFGLDPKLVAKHRAELRAERGDRSAA